MTARARALLGIAVAMVTPEARTRHAEEWAADLDGAIAEGMSPTRFAVGMIFAATRFRASNVRAPRRKVVALGLSIALAATLTTVAVVTPRRSFCTRPHQVLGVVRGAASLDVDDALPERSNAAMRAVRAEGGFEGVWIGPHASIEVGVYGPTWERVRPTALAVSAVPGPPVRYICQPATERQLVLAQQALRRSPLQHHGLIGYTDIDVQHATVEVGLFDTAPPQTEAELRREYGSRLEIHRAAGPFVVFQPTTGRTPLLADNEQQSVRRAPRPPESTEHVPAAVLPHLDPKRRLLA